MNYRLCFIVQAGKEHGTGHLQRCLRMAALCESPFFLIHSDLADSSPLKNLVPFPHKILSSESRGKIQSFLEGQNFDALIIDCAKPFSQVLEACSLGIPTLVMDNPRLGKKSDIYVKSLPSQNNCPANFNGIWHSPIGEEFFNLPPGGEGVLITMGGSDPLNSAPKAAEAFRGSGQPVTLICGALSQYPPIKPYEGLNLSPPVPNLAPYFQKHSLIICGPGMTLLQARAAGKKTLVIAHSPSQHRSLRGKDVPVLMGGCLLSPRSIQKAAQRAEASSLNIPEGFVFSSWFGQLLDSLAQGPASCPLCGSHHKNALLRSTEGSVFSCKNCKSRYFHPLRHPKEEQKESGLESLFKGGSPPMIGWQGSLLRSKENTRRLHTLKKLSPTAAAGGGHRLLDISLNDGSFVQSALDSGARAWGLDMGGLRLHDLYHIEAFDTLERASASAPYTLITLWDKLSLCPNPLKTLRHLGALLSTGGVLAFCAPCAPAANFPPGTYFQMSARGGRLLALRVGLKPLKAELTSDIHGEKYWEIYCARS